EIIATLSRPDADPHWSLDDSGLLCYDGRVWVPDVNDLRLQILLKIMITQYRVTSVRTRLWNSSEESILGQVLGCLLKTIVSPARCALDPKHHVTSCTDFFNNFRFRKNHGTQFQ